MTTRLCTNCQKPLERRMYERPYAFARRTNCSKACASKIQGASRAGVVKRDGVKVCVCCGDRFAQRDNEFQSQFVRRRTCSAECRSKLGGMNRAQILPPRTCARESCGLTFTPNRKNQKFCREECTTLALNERSAKRPMQPDDGYVIAYVRSPTSRTVRPIKYIDVIYPTEAIARREMADLLRYYPADHKWRRKLSVQAWPSVVEKAEAA